MPVTKALLLPGNKTPQGLTPGASVGVTHSLPAVPVFQKKANDKEAIEGEAKPRQLKSDPLYAGALQGHAAVPPFPIQKKANKTGLPDNLKAGVEHLSGFAMDDVKVHYNSAKPATLQAHAYAQGTEIHIAPGQEKHLPHEAWHVAQQKQGRVKPTLQMKGVAINDESGLEREADVMGRKSAGLSQRILNTKTNQRGIADDIAQLITKKEIEQLAAVGSHIIKLYPESLYVGIGGSPSPIIAYLQSIRAPAYNIPLSIKDFGERVLKPEQQEELKKMIEECIGPEAGEKELLLMDVAGSGGSIASAVRVIQNLYPKNKAGIKGIGIKTNDNEMKAFNNNKNLAVVNPRIIHAQQKTDNEDKIDVTFFLDKLENSAYKQYRAVGVFKPQEGDIWSVYKEYEQKLEEKKEAEVKENSPRSLAGIKITVAEKSEHKAAEPPFDYGSRKRYQALQEYLATYKNDKSAKLPQEYENYDEDSLAGPRNRHKEAEDENAKERIKKINAAVKEQSARIELEGELKKEGKKSGCCLLTTACTLWKGLADDCIELQTLRGFRDDYILKKENGWSMVSAYYKNSPLIIQRINESEDPGAVYDDVYYVISYCVNRIFEEEYEKAFEVYVELILKLKDCFTPGMKLDYLS